MLQVNILEAKNQLSKLVQASEEVIIANRGAAVVRLAAVTLPETPVPGSPQAFVAWLKFRPPLPPESRRTVEEIDAGIAEERAAWD